MKSFLEKLNYKGQKRIAVINAEKNYRIGPVKVIRDVQIDHEIDQRFPYDFMIIFVRFASEVEQITPVVLHNLVAEGMLWFFFPKQTSKKNTGEIDRDHGWEALNDAGFYGTRLVEIDDDWSALRFRNIKYIKSSSEKFVSEKNHKTAGKKCS